MHNFSVNCKVFDASNVIDIHKYLMKKHDKKIIKMFKNIFKMFIWLLSSIVNAFNHRKCVSLSN